MKARIRIRAYNIVVLFYYFIILTFQRFITLSFYREHREHLSFHLFITNEVRQVVLLLSVHKFQ
jgi:hypothetical protein